MDGQSIHVRYAQASEMYEAFRGKGLQLNMARGKPAADQLEMVQQLLELPGRNNYTSVTGLDCRNYGGDGRGLPEARELFSLLVGTPPDNVVAKGNSSLALMHDHIVFSLLKGNPDSRRPWCREAKLRFLCPVPGYDYHFNMTEQYGIEMIPVALGEHGPDMDQVEHLVASDASVKGMWCVPKYSNPNGAVYSDEVVHRLAIMDTAAPDFRIFWDNAYAVHHLTDERVEIADLLGDCEDAGHPNRALMFASTSKITMPGAGVGVFASSNTNVDWFVELSGRRSIGPDKINQLRHLAMLPDHDAILALMDAHRRLLAPKFEAVDTIFDEYLSAPAVATWTKPKGGYFISLFTPEGCAQRAIELSEGLGIELTPAGAAFPYGNDPNDNHIRIAPTSLPLADVKQAAEGIAIAVLRAVAESTAA